MTIKKWQNHSGLVLDSVNGFDVIECETCRVKHIVPIPTQEELTLTYSQDYYTKEKPLYLERHQEDLDWWNLVYSERYDTFEQLLSPTRRRILDVGSGPGFFLLQGKQRGWETLGIEPSAQAVDHSRALGLNIIEAFFGNDIAHIDKLGFFDVIHMSNMLEHVPDPINILQLAHHLLSDSGIFCCVVPNDYNPFQQALRKACLYQPWWVAPPHHINYFNFNSLTQLFHACGFDVVIQEATFPIDIFLLMGENYVGNDALGRLCHGKRKNLEKNLAAAGLNDIKRSMYRCFSANELGREAVLFGAKKSH
jgi:SAM-dependent methyltransferase